ncbi:BZ3500_MvSof-1268-A1-R1_Chr8-1g09994 [Microbotryum saponariae]|uniref:BZ3500_MvSof-1268-A1-R1_Chr8-1g09994 protein n=1 Tax=Microbotryum saponariae TaxID=289078 RepID=A0A2X0KT05_9BASI|nr:BZ3500_MvSof-1268-A1-R1_Chr8-1g09994 [Microbotryum saponariae]SDA08280.1 BZ3501_MvSof-1269-A2-R1_Chr8-1g09717 [Microbotryum saponariae]
MSPPAQPYVNTLSALPGSTETKAYSKSDDLSSLESDNRHGKASTVLSSDEGLLDLYKPLSNWEGAHRYDPTAQWTEAEEKAVVRKTDWRICLVACLVMVCLQLDRGNIVNALSDNMLGDLKLSTNDYNLGQTIFYCSFLFMELPSQLISKAIGVDRWVPIQIIIWSIVAASQAALKGKTSFFITRSLIGALEGGVIPDLVLYLSYFYKGDELTTRLSFFWVTLSSTTIVGSLLAAGILQLRGAHGLEGWRWLFLIEALFTLTAGIFALFYLPASPTETAGGLRGKKGWFTEREEIIIVNRVIRDDPTKSSMHNREASTSIFIPVHLLRPNGYAEPALVYLMRLVGILSLWKSFMDFDLWPLYLLGLTTFIAPATAGAYFTLTLRSLKFSTFHTNLLQIPYLVLFICQNLGLVWLARKLNSRLLVASIGSFWQLLFLIVLVAIPDNLDRWAKYAITSLLLAFPYAHPILVSLNSRNSGSVRTRSVSASLYNMFVQAGSIVASNIYQSKDKPYYRHGNRVLLGIVSANIVLFFLAKVYYVARNQQRAKKWEALTVEQRRTYLETTKDEGNRRLDFKFAH